MGKEEIATRMDGQTVAITISPSKRFFFKKRGDKKAIINTYCDDNKDNLV